MTAIHTLAFAEPDAPTLGAIWLPGDGAPALLGCRVGSEQRVVSARLDVGAEGDPWKVEGDGVSLLFAPAGPAVAGGPPEKGWDSIDQLCEVSGTLALDGHTHEIRCMGWRENLDGRFELGAIDSFRQTSGWFEGDGGISLAAYRPQKSRGQDGDLVAGAVVENEPAPRVIDPRLSTTYDASGTPSRVGVELWFESESSDEELPDDDERRFPRRAAAEATGARVDWEVAGFRIQAALLHWRSRGNEGTGVYLLGQRG